MAITIEEMGPARSGSATEISRKYILIGTQSETLVLSALLSGTPTVIGDYVRNDGGISFELKSEGEGGQWDCTVPYEQQEYGAPPVGEFSYQFSYTAPSAQIYQSLETVWASSGARNFDGAIQVVDDGGKFRVEGLNLGGGAETFKWSYSMEGAAFDDTYQRAIEDLVGKVNENTFKGRARGSLRLVRVSGGVSSKDRATIEYGVEYIPNQSSDIAIGSALSVDVSEIVVGASGGWFGGTPPPGAGGTKHGFKEGHQLLWTYYEHGDDSINKRLIKKPDAVYVERIYEYADFADLGF